jgi:hypothetical protein
VNRLRQRLAKLEIELGRSTQEAIFTDVFEAALSRLFPGERGLVQQVMRHEVHPAAETHRAAWNRLQVLIAEETEALGFAVLIQGSDLLA